MFQPRFANGVYRDCKWCHGKGCLACEGEAEKEYKRQFPDGPQPIATFNTSELGQEGVSGLLRQLIGKEAQAAAESEGEKRATEALESNPFIRQIVDLPESKLKPALTQVFSRDALVENMVNHPQNTIKGAKVV